jgi:hypothetical protein
VAAPCDWSLSTHEGTKKRVMRGGSFERRSQTFPKARNKVLVFPKANALAKATSTSFLGPLVRKMCFTHVELALNPPPRFILQPAAAIQLISLLPFGGEQQKFNLVAKLDMPSMAVVAIASVLDVLEPIIVI